MRYATADGTAAHPANYQAASGELTWSDGDVTPRSVCIPIVDDHVYTSNLDFTLSLFNATGGAMLGLSCATGTIYETDLAPPTQANTPPIPEIQMLSALTSTPVSVTLKAYDADNDPLSFAIVRTDMNGGSLTGTLPDLVYHSGTKAGSGNIFFTVSDGKSTSAVTRLFIAVNVASSQLPRVDITYPTNCACFIAPGRVAINAAVSAPVGFDHLFLFDNNDYIANITNTPCQCDWYPTAGSHTLFALLYDRLHQCGAAYVKVTVLLTKPVLDFRHVGQGAGMVRWPIGVDGWLLEEATDLGDTWTPCRQPVSDVPPYHASVVPLSGRKFYRIKAPQ